jgi:hypothetical protein
MNVGDETGNDAMSVAKLDQGLENSALNRREKIITSSWNGVWAYVVTIYFSRIYFLFYPLLRYRWFATARGTVIQWRGT